MTFPTREEATATVKGSSFWTFNIALWLILGCTAVTLALCLAIWNLIEAF